MKRAISLILVVGLVCLSCAFLVAADSNETAITVFQENTNYNQWSWQSPVYYGGLNSSNYTYPINLCIPSAAVGTFTSAKGPTSVVIDVSDPLIGKKGTTVYVGFYVAYSTFKGSSSMSTYFTWDPSIPGYMMRAAASSSYGPNRTDYISVSAPSNFAPVIKRTQAGSSSGATFPSSSYSVLGSYTPYTQEPQTGGAWYMQPNWVSASSSYKVMKISIGSNNDAYSNVRIELDTNDVSKFSCSTAISDTYPLVGVFVPLCLVVDTTEYSQSMLDKLDDIIQALADLNQNVTDSTADIVTILNDNFADILAALGSSTGSHDNVLDYLSSMVTAINGIQVALQHQSVNPNAFSSAIQYIEYYLSQVLTDTNTIAAYIADISNTLNQISNTIQSANDQLDAIDGTAEDVHDQEDAIFDDATQAIENQIIDGFAFDADFGLGAARAGLDWDALWRAIGPWNQVIMFSMMMTYAFTILRFRAVPKDHVASSKPANLRKGRKGG